MDALGSFFGTVGNTINRFSTFTGGVIDTAIEGTFGLGTIHAGALKIGKVCYDSRLTYLATQVFTTFAAVHIASPKKGGWRAHFRACAAPLIGEDLPDHVARCPTTERKSQKATQTRQPLSLATRMQRRLKIAISAGIIYTLNTTNCGFTPLTSAATKDLLAKAALTFGDAYALTSSHKDGSSKTTKWTAGAYMSARFADILVNYGAVTQGLVRLNPQPLLSNVSWISAKIW